MVKAGLLMGQAQIAYHRRHSPLFLKGQRFQNIPQLAEILLYPLTARRIAEFEEKNGTILLSANETDT